MAAPGPRPGPDGPLPRPTVVVVGGGIAGLSAALALASAPEAPRVVVLEASARLGGKLASAEIGGRTVDLGPDAFLARRPEAVDLCRELGLDSDLVAPGRRNAFVLVRGRLRPLPDGLALGVPTRLAPLARSGILSPPGLARAALDLASPGRGPDRPPGSVPDRAVAAVTTARLGREVTELLVDPLVGGIHAGDTARMSAAAVFPPLLEAAPGHSLMRALRPPGPAAAPDGPVFLTVRGGLGRLVGRLAETLAGRGVELATGCGARRLERAGPGHPARWRVHHDGGVVEADGVVVAAPAGVGAALLGPLDPAAARALAAVEYADVALVTVRLAADDVGAALDGTGFLVPRRGGGLVTACTWLTAKWPELARPWDVVVRASVGRQGDDRAGALDDDELAIRVRAELAPVMALRGRPLETVVTRWAGAFPQYAVGHLERVAAVEEAATRLGTVAVAGAALRGVGIPACIGSGRRAAASVLAGMAGSTAAAP